MAEVKKVKHVVTNVTNGPKVLNSLPIVTLQPGQSTEGAVELTEAEFDSAKGTEWFKFGAAAAARGADKD